MKEVFQSLQAMDVADGSVRIFDRAACEFAYRDSVFKREFKDHHVITSMTFGLPRAARLHLDYGALREELERIQANHHKVPHYPAPGGKIKLAAGWLIEQCGWKGKSLGRAGVHEQHALVLVNRGGATGAEILALARAIQTSVGEKFSIALEAEPVIV